MIIYAYISSPVPLHKSCGISLPEMFQLCDTKRHSYSYRVFLNHMPCANMPIPKRRYAVQSAKYKGLMIDQGLRLLSIRGSTRPRRGDQQGRLADLLGRLRK